MSAVDPLEGVLTPTQRQTLIAILNAEHARLFAAQLRGEAPPSRANEVTQIAHALHLHR